MGHEGSKTCPVSDEDIKGSKKEECWKDGLEILQGYTTWEEETSPSKSGRYER